MDKNLDYYIKGYEANEKTISLLSKDFGSYEKDTTNKIKSLTQKSSQVKSISQKNKILETIETISKQLSLQRERYNIQIESYLKENEEFCGNIKKITKKSTCK